MDKKETNKKNSPKKEEIDGFEIHINEFGEIVTNRPIEKLNEFLDDNVEDLKLKNRIEEEE